MAEPRNQLHKIAGKKCYILLPGRTFQSQEAYIKNYLEELTGLEMVPSVEECDVILVFCAIQSRAGTDIDSAMKQLNTLSPSKPAVFMVGHHTFDPEKTVTDSNKYVTRTNTLIVDCLFNEELLLNFPKNMETLEKIIEWLLQQDTQKPSKECLDKLRVSSELILVLLGTSGFEKTAVANMIFGREDSQEDLSQATQRKTIVEDGEVCVDVEGEHERWKVVLFNTPDKLSSGHFEEEMQQSLFLISLISQKPYALLLVISEKPCTEERETAVKMKDFLQERFSDRLLIISTVTDEPKLIGNVVQEQCISCDHVLNISQREDRSQVSKLMKKVEEKLERHFNRKFTDSEIETAITNSNQVLIGEARDYNKRTLKNPTHTVWFSPEPNEPFVLMSKVSYME
ncbi:uncharacterized protein LOC564033 [Danio rerio]|uniref:Si:dkey-58f10.6 n=1 Tax=Danio rerio TaxID=7955 RepID=A0A8M1P3H3_DANRE|nr:uncharacterized protein LOC564033 [Danio rerio]NP_001313483.1 uncharacterized protein LOC564033 [Danio rerio]|eukprot:NP_001313482.1 uncharacterized protein LOC564033 [Danio rerio]